MELRSNLKFYKARIEELNFDSGTDGVNAIAIFSGILSTEVADELGKKDFCFDRNGIAREFDGSIKWREHIRNVEIVCAADNAGNVFRPNIIRCLAVKHADSKDGDITLRLSMRAHCSEQHVQLLDFLKAVNQREFSFTLEPLQGALFESGDEAQEHAEAAKA